MHVLERIFRALAMGAENPSLECCPEVPQKGGRFPLLHRDTLFQEHSQVLPKKGARDA